MTALTGAVEWKMTDVPRRRMELLYSAGPAQIMTGDGGYVDSKTTWLYDFKPYIYCPGKVFNCNGGHGVTICQSVMNFNLLL